LPSNTYEAKELLKKILKIGCKIAKKLGYNCRVSLRELQIYLTAPTYTGDKTNLKTIASNPYLCLHEVLEVMFLKERGYTISWNIFNEAYPYTYEAHLKALKGELKLALKKRDAAWISKRLKDLESYLNDPLLPEYLRPRVCDLIKMIKTTMNEHKFL